jgi:eukaryotic-like serine/threonine-protein kinase
MNQNPNDGPNYNPYGQNQPNPNYPPGTAYGSGAQPPSGPNPGYNPYPPANPPSGPNPNTPNSSYGQYGTPNPYAPPPPPGPIQGTGPNPYDPYGQTAMSQNSISNPGYPNPVSSPGYPPYNPQPATAAPMYMPPTPTQPRGRGMTVLISVIVLVVLVGGIAFAGIAYNGNQQTLHANATGTAQAQTTGIAQTATAIANTYPFSSTVVLSDPMLDNSKGIRWDDDKTTGCFFSGSAYHVIQADSAHYNTCAAIGSDFSDFTFETEMVIKSGGDSGSGGLLFRADENNSQFYRLSIDTNGNYFILAIVDNTGTVGNARKLKEGTASSFSSGVGTTNTLAIVARGNNYSFYVNQQLVTSFTDGTYTHGQIGFDADYGTSSTELVFTNVKVWKIS